MGAVYRAINEKIGRAVARVHQQTGVPISTHSHMGSRGGLAQLDLLEQEASTCRA